MNATLQRCACLCAGGLWLLAGPAAQAAPATEPLNDTGVKLCVDMTTLTFTKVCADTGQDGANGRDVTNKSGKDGRRGFSFRKICHSGEAAGKGNCPADPVLGTAATDWGCTLDKVTGLIWEIKRSNGLRDKNLRYTHLGNGAGTDTSGFVAAVNSQGLCGAQDWRLPTTVELQSIVDYGVHGSPPMAIDKQWLPNLGLPGGNPFYWASDTYVPNAGAWVVDFARGEVAYGALTDSNQVRLVRKQP